MFAPIKLAHNLVNTIIIVHGHDRAWPQFAFWHDVLGTNMSRHNHVWAQTCLGTIMYGHNRVGTIMSVAQTWWKHTNVSTVFP